MKPETKKKIINWLEWAFAWTDKIVQPKPLIRVSPCTTTRYYHNQRAFCLELKRHWWRKEWKVLAYHDSGKPRLFPSYKIACDYVRNKCKDCKLVEKVKK